MYVQAGPVEGAIFADYGSDLGSGSTVPGNVVCLHFSIKHLWMHTTVLFIYVHVKLGDL